MAFCSTHSKFNFHGFLTLFKFFNFLNQTYSDGIFIVFWGFSLNNPLNLWGPSTIKQFKIKKFEVLYFEIGLDSSLNDRVFAHFLH